MDQVVDDEAADERERYPDNRQREREAKRTRGKEKKACRTMLARIK